MEQKIYLDNAASTRVRPEVLEAMMRFFSEDYANPSGVYGAANLAKAAIDEAKGKIAECLGAANSEIYFTGSGTESINWAIKATAGGNPCHIITSVIEHHAVLHTCQYLEKNGFDITYLPVDKHGLVNPADLEAAVRPETILVTIMLANNEIGTFMPISEIGTVLKEINAKRKADKMQEILFHTDAVQALGHIPIDVAKLGVDMLSVSAHKVYGPKGVGALYVRRNTRLPAFIHGGGQERGRRAGTENVAGIVGFGLAAQLACAEMDKEAKRLAALRDDFIGKILEIVPHAHLNGHPKLRLPGNINITFDFIEGEGILLLLDVAGFLASSGSACTSGTLDPSHVIMALGTPAERAHGSLRITLGRYNTQEDMDKLLAALPPIIERLRRMSPIYS